MYNTLDEYPQILCLGPTPIGPAPRRLAFDADAQSSRTGIVQADVEGQDLPVLGSCGVVRWLLVGFLFVC